MWILKKYILNKVYDFGMAEFIKIVTYKKSGFL